jgi:hypothetical protein
MMVLPGIAGQWADKQLGTSFLTLTGFALGMTVALWQLIKMGRDAEQKRLAEQAARSEQNKTKRSQTEDDGRSRD